MSGRTHFARRLSFEDLQPRQMLAAVTGVDPLDLDPADQFEVAYDGIDGESEVQDVSMTKYVDKSSTPLMPESGGEDRLTEDVALNFAEVKTTYQPQGDDGAPDCRTLRNFEEYKVT